MVARAYPTGPGQRTATGVWLNPVGDKGVGVKRPQFIDGAYGRIEISATILGASQGFGEAGMTVLVIAMMHAVPVVFTAILSQRQSAVNWATGVMCIVAIVGGNPAYTIVDLVAIGIGYAVASGFLHTRGDQEEPGTGPSAVKENDASTRREEEYEIPDNAAMKRIRCEHQVEGNQGKQADVIDHDQFANAPESRETSQSGTELLGFESPVAPLVIERPDGFHVMDEEAELLGFESPAVPLVVERPDGFHVVGEEVGELLSASGMGWKAIDEECTEAHEYNDESKVWASIPNPHGDRRLVFEEFGQAKRAAREIAIEAEVATRVTRCWDDRDQFWEVQTEFRASVPEYVVDATYFLIVNDLPLNSDELEE